MDFYVVPAWTEQDEIEFRQLCEENCFGEESCDGWDIIASPSGSTETSNDCTTSSFESEHHKDTEVCEVIQNVTHAEDHGSVDEVSTQPESSKDMSAEATSNAERAVSEEDPPQQCEVVETASVCQPTGQEHEWHANISATNMSSKSGPPNVDDDCHVSGDQQRRDSGSSDVISGLAKSAVQDEVTDPKPKVSRTSTTTPRRTSTSTASYVPTSAPRSTNLRDSDNNHNAVRHTRLLSQRDVHKDAARVPRSNSSRSLESHDAIQSAFSQSRQVATPRSAENRRYGHTQLLQNSSAHLGDVNFNQPGQSLDRSKHNIVHYANTYENTVVYNEYTGSRVSSAVSGAAAGTIVGVIAGAMMPGRGASRKEKGRASGPERKNHPWSGNAALRGAVRLKRPSRSASDASLYQSIDRLSKKSEDCVTQEIEKSLDESLRVHDLQKYGHNLVYLVIGCGFDSALEILLEAGNLVKPLSPEATGSIRPDDTQLQSSLRRSYWLFIDQCLMLMNDDEQDTKRARCCKILYIILLDYFAKTKSHISLALHKMKLTGGLAAIERGLKQRSDRNGEKDTDSRERADNKVERIFLLSFIYRAQRRYDEAHAWYERISCLQESTASPQQQDVDRFLESLRCERRVRAS